RELFDPGHRVVAETKGERPVAAIDDPGVAREAQVEERGAHRADTQFGRRAAGRDARRAGRGERTRTRGSGAQSGSCEHGIALAIRRCTGPEIRQEPLAREGVRGGRLAAGGPSRRRRASRALPEVAGPSLLRMVGGTGMGGGSEWNANAQQTDAVTA